MLGARSSSLQSAVADAVNLVNAHSGQASVHLRFNSDDFAEVDLVANSATLQGDHFSFTAGFETVGGTLAELADIRAEVIGRRLS
jgi:hypothetical protein